MFPGNKGQSKKSYYYATRYFLFSLIGIGYLYTVKVKIIVIGQKMYFAILFPLILEAT